jgi:hypothetical protein
MKLNGMSADDSYPSMSNYGGKKKGKKSMTGGYKSLSPLNNIASTASPYSGATAQPQVFVGGKTKKRGKKGLRKGGKKSVKNGRKRTKKM